MVVIAEASSDSSGGGGSDGSGKSDGIGSSRPIGREEQDKTRQDI